MVFRKKTKCDKFTTLMLLNIHKENIEMYDFPSPKFLETYNFIKWAAENWELFANCYRSQYKPQEPDEAFLKASIELIEACRKESYHMCIIMYLLENMSFLAHSTNTAFFETATWLLDEKRVKYFEDRLLEELRSELKAKQIEK